MNLDDFEQRLARTPLPAPPADLRRSVLEVIRRECEPAKPAEAPIRGTRSSEMIRRWFERLASPWAVPGAACAVVLALMTAGAWLDDRRQAGTSVASMTQPKPTRLEVVTALRSQGAQWAAWMGTGAEFGAAEESEPAPDSTDQPRGATRPRTEWRPVRREAMDKVNRGMV